MDMYHLEVKHKICWSSVFVGVISSILLALLLSGLFLIFGIGEKGLFNINSPFLLNFSMPLLSLICLVLTMALGGWLAGHFANYRGALHGFLVWAILSIITLLSVYSIYYKQTASALSPSSASLQQNLARGVNASAGDNAPQLLDGNADNFINNLYKDINSLLGSVNLPFLKPDQLESLANQAQQTINQAWSDINIYPAQKKKILDYLITHLNESKNKLNEIKSVDQEKIMTFLKEKGVTGEKSQDIAKKAISTYKAVVDLFDEKLDNVSKSLKDNEATASLAPAGSSYTASSFDPSLSPLKNKYGLWKLGVALLLGGLLSVLFGFLGARSNCPYCHFGDYNVSESSSRKTTKRKSDKNIRDE